MARGFGCDRTAVTLATVFSALSLVACGHTFTRKTVNVPGAELPIEYIHPHNRALSAELVAGSRVVTVYVEQRFECDVLKQRTHRVGEVVTRDDGLVDDYTQPRVVAEAISANVPCDVGPARNIRVELEAGGQRVTLGGTGPDGRLSVDLSDVLGAHNGVSISEVARTGTLWIAGAPQPLQVALDDWWRFEKEYESDLAAARESLRKALEARGPALEPAAQAIASVQAKNPKLMRDKRLDGLLKGIDDRIKTETPVVPTPELEQQARTGSVTLDAIGAFLRRMGVGFASALGPLMLEAIAFVVEILKENAGLVCTMVESAAVAFIAGKIDKRVASAFPLLGGVLELAALVSFTPSAIVFYLVRRSLGNQVSAAMETWVTRKCEELIGALPSPARR